MDTTSSQDLIRRLVAGDPTATPLLVDRAGTSADPAVLVAAALVVPVWEPLLERAAATARDVPERQVVAIAAAHLRGEHDRALLLARDHLADHPGNALVAHIAAAAGRC
ncbi:MULTISPECIES: hypothetical protein [unclassified Geodermatophilus]|uniref:hypothetical protein n=1 Tax=unclassified Geodermatophilus TaxID=2637632 RepID=UPI003EEB415A